MDIDMVKTNTQKNTDKNTDVSKININRQAKESPISMDKIEDVVNEFNIICEDKELNPNERGVALMLLFQSQIFWAAKLGTIAGAKHMTEEMMKTTEDKYKDIYS